MIARAAAAIHDLFERKLVFISYLPCCITPIENAQAAVALQRHLVQKGTRSLGQPRSAAIFGVLPGACGNGHNLCFKIRR